MSDSPSSDSFDAARPSASGLQSGKAMAPPGRELTLSGLQGTTKTALLDVVVPQLGDRFQLTSQFASGLVILIGVLSLAGWVFEIEALQRPFGESGLRSAVAINFIAVALSIISISAGSTRTWRVLFAKVVAAIVSLACAATYVEHTFELQWNNFTLWESPGAPPLTYPGPLLPFDSACFVLVGVGILLYGVCWKNKVWLSQVCGAVALVPNFVVLCLYLMGQSHLCIYLGCVKFSPTTSMAFVMLCFSLIFSSPERGFVRVFSLRSTTGTLSRRTLIGVGILLLLLLPRQLLIASDLVPKSVLGEGDLNMGTAMVVLLAMAAFGWWCFRKVDSGEAEKQQTIIEREQVIEQKEQEIQLLQSGNSVALQNMKLVCLECAREFTDRDLTHCPDDNSSLVMIMDNLRPGAWFADRYRIVRELGSGGMSTVYLARHEMMKKDVALKVLQTQYSSDAKMIQRFQREARAASSLSHPNLVTVHDFNVTTEGQAFMVMEFLEGISLADSLKDDGPMPWRRAVQLFLQISEGINHAHANGVIHRDLKPGNVMLLPAEGEPGFLAKIVDFGFAKVGDDAAQHLTRTGEVFGSPLYMSPEQCRGQAMDKRSDLYAFGCMMYACLTGEPPFEGGNIMETLSMHLNKPPPPVPKELEVPGWLEKLVHKLMEKDPAARCQSAVDVIVALNVGLSTMAANASTKQSGS